MFSVGEVVFTEQDNPAPSVGHLTVCDVAIYGHFPVAKEKLEHH